MHNTTAALRLDQQLTAAFEQISPERAEEMLGKNVGNRNMKPRKIAALGRDIVNDSFMTTGEAIKFDWNGRLIDGQNRLAAIVNAKKTVTTLVVRGLDPAVQAFLDTGTKRSSADALRMNGSAANNETTAAAVRLAAAYEDGLLPTAISRAPEMTHAELIEWWEPRAEAMTAATAQARAWFKRIGAPPSALAACIYLTMQADAEDSHRFFYGMAELDLDGKDDPRTALIRRLQNLRNERYTLTQVMYYILRTWGAWRAGRSLTHIKDRNANGPARMPKVA